MFTSETIPGLILGLREGLEAFLMIGIILDYLKKSGETRYVRPVQAGLVTGIFGSLLLGLALWGLSLALGTVGGQTGKLWEVVASLLGLALLSTFLVWMMKHGRSVYHEVHAEIKAHFSAVGLFLIALVMVLREGAEIALFAFSSTDKMAYVTGIGLGVVVAAMLAWAITHALVKVNLKVLFTVTLGYLVLQSGYLLGYGVHELLSVLAALGVLPADSFLLVKAWKLDGLWDHKTGLLGLPLNVLIGWYSRPEWLQFCLQLGYIGVMGAVWRRLLGRKPPKTA